MHSILSKSSAEQYLSKSHSARNIVGSRNNLDFESTRTPLTPQLRSTFSKGYPETSANLLTFQYNNRNHSQTFSNDLLGPATQPQPRSTTGRSSPFNSRHLGQSSNKSTAREFVVDNSPLSKSHLTSSTTQGFHSSKRSGVKDPRDSSYANAMKALQSKIKSLEEQVIEMVSQRAREIEENHHIIENLKDQQRRERNEFEQIESKLQTRVELLEHELKEKAKQLNDLAAVNNQLKDQLLNSETDRKREFQHAFNERNQFKIRLSELEQRAEAETRRNKEVKQVEKQLVKERDHLRSQVEQLQEKCMRLEKEGTEKDANNEAKLKELAERKAVLERNLKICKAELDRELAAWSRREKELKQQNEELTKDKSDLLGQVRDLRSYTKERDSEIQSKHDALGRKEKELSRLKDHFDSMLKEQEKTRMLSDVTHHYAHDFAEVNERLLSTFLESTKNRTTPGKVFAFNEQREDTHYGQSLPTYNSDRILLSELEARGHQEQSRVRGSHIGRIQAAELRSDRTSYFGAQSHSPKLKSPIRTEKTQPESTDRFNFSNTRRRHYSHIPPSSVRRLEGELSSGNQMRKAGYEAEYDGLIKKIVGVEKELLDLSKQYRVVNSSLLNHLLSEEEKSRNRAELSDLSDKMQRKNEELITLKKREEEIVNKLL